MSETKPKNPNRGGNDGQEGEEVCGFKSCSDCKKGCYVHGEIDPKSREKDDAREEGQEEIFPALSTDARAAPAPGSLKMTAQRAGAPMASVSGTPSNSYANSSKSFLNPHFSRHGLIWQRRFGGSVMAMKDGGAGRRGGRDVGVGFSSGPVGDAAVLARRSFACVRPARRGLGRRQPGGARRGPSVRRLGRLWPWRS